MMRQPLHMAIMQYGKQSQTAATVAAAHPIVAVSPFPHNTISRVFVNTIGRLGRWKRVLNSRGPVQATMTVGVDVSAFDVEANETGDLLLVKGGVEQYLRLVESQMNVTIESTSTMSTTTTAVASPPAKLPPLPQSPRSPSSMVRVPASEGLSPPPARIVEDEEPEELPPNYYDTESGPRPSMSSYNSLDEESLRSVPVARRTVAPKTHADLDIVSIDDHDLSDLSSDENIEVAPPPAAGLGLKKATRKLPTRRDFEFVRQSMSSVSSMGIRTRESMLSRSCVVSSSSEVEVDDGEGGEMGGPIQAWQINAILDSLSGEEESGDVEAALRRLEGQINQDKVKEKQSKVDQWIQSMAKRQPGGQSRESVGSLSDEEDYGQVERRRFSGDSAQDLTIGMSATSPQLSSRSSMISIPQAPSASTSMPSTSATSPEQQQLSLDMLQVSGGRSDPASSDGDALTPLTEARPLVEDAVPLEILRVVSHLVRRHQLARRTKMGSHHNRPSVWFHLRMCHHRS